jgi:hypothetical protein
MVVYSTFFRDWITYTLATSILAVDHDIIVLLVHAIVSLYMDLWVAGILNTSNLNQSGRRGNCKIRRNSETVSPTDDHVSGYKLNAWALSK